MANAAPQLKEFARRLLAYELASRKPADTKKLKNLGALGAFRVCEELRGPLCKIMGTGGFRALMSRALVLAGAEVPWLRSLKIQPDGSLEGFEELKAKTSESELAEGEVVLVAQLHGLLVTFIGPALTLRLMQEAWPKAAFDDVKFGREEML